MNNEIKEKLKSYKILFLDADGVFFTGHEMRSVVDGKVVVTKTRHFIDGQGVSFLREIGIQIVFVTGEGEPLKSIVDKINNLPSALSGRWKKVEIFEGKNSKGSKMATISEFLLNNNILIENVAYMGDDINDFEPMSKIREAGGLTITPGNGTRKIKPLAQIITMATGGNGAIREFADLTLEMRGLDESTFPPA